MGSCCLTNCLGSCHKRWWSGGLVQMRTVWNRCHPWRLWHINPRISKMTWDSPEQGENASLEEADRVVTLQPGKLKKLVNQLVPAHRRGDPFFVPAFLSTYRKFATTRQVLDLLFLRYRFFHPDSEEDQQNKSALSSLLETWLFQYPGDFCRCPDLASLKQLVAYALVNLPDSQIVPQVCGLLSRPGAH
ncbi:PREDICTED: ral guanine nucleotide dissociation stimulator-like [Chinchilla lanigera]|uniref:Ral guanine nucleotide dissociation stimulator-like n=1 Tax=Chinchilla lanigera TaxID=34839 RepID=A0A8C2VAR2_CHILA|nr:PREDICTED: ral guanine nucleotide dissociation stimulator-like [Chinchilla lanigera]XP_013361576.1 PREDICTED: ral guanine nucleotide dissociation stimulator-like [Chinchilla lanigera]